MSSVSTLTSERLTLLVEAYKELLGPLNGWAECLSFQMKPHQQYVTGVLRPRVEEVYPVVNKEAEEASVGAESSSEADIEEQADTTIRTLLSPNIRPTQRPYSMGISFYVKGRSPRLHLLLSWARYKEAKDDDNTSHYCREPRWVYVEVELKEGRLSVPRHQTSSQLSLSPSSGSSTQIRLSIQSKGTPEAEVFLIIKPAHPSSHETHFVRISLVNAIPSHSGAAPAGNGAENQEGEDIELSETEYLFQPQIRVNIAEGALADLDEARGMKAFAFQEVKGENQEAKEEDEEVKYLYRHRKVYARGHLCAAVWREIDIEAHAASASIPNTFFYAEGYPFTWVDGAAIEQELSKIPKPIFSPKDFIAPHVRSEYLPVYGIPAPDYTWKCEKSPELEAEKLAELYTPSDLGTALEPLYLCYEDWIKNHDGGKDPVSHRLIEKSNKIRDRIKKGIDVLKRDPEARLAFCFAMKAISLQAEWAGKRSFTWRPFQLAFILMVIESIVNQNSPDRNVMDLLWVATGGGKTEAYLAIVGFTIVYRRLREQKRGGTGVGVSVISRYTLRLLTGQQFRRALRLITACEYLRVQPSPMNPSLRGWHPTSYKPPTGVKFLYGEARFSIGLWVGGGLTPNRLHSYHFHSQDKSLKKEEGAIDILSNPAPLSKGKAEPAQVTTCPACGTLLALPDELEAGTRFFVVLPPSTSPPPPPPHIASSITLSKLHSLRSRYLVQEIQVLSTIPSSSLRGWRLPVASLSLLRPGYFPVTIPPHSKTIHNFEIYCPNPECKLHTDWEEHIPVDWRKAKPTPKGRKSKDTVSYSSFSGNFPAPIVEAFRDPKTGRGIAIPIPAYTVDDQIYHRLPSMVIATVDKYAMLPFQPRAGGMFGNVSHYHLLHGYYRPYNHPLSTPSTLLPHPTHTNPTTCVELPGTLPPPDLIIQDELHLIDGSLGSLVGFYETAIDFLCKEGMKAYLTTRKLSGPENYTVKYISSTATIRRAGFQIKALFNREHLIFPQPISDIDDAFFVRHSPINEYPLWDERAGRYYVGVCGIGRTTMAATRLWASLLQTAFHPSSAAASRYIHTTVGYFNAIRELAFIRSILPTDITDTIKLIASRKSTPPRPISLIEELSSRKSSVEIPLILDRLTRATPPADVLLSTSMFGTGVDVPQLSIMVVDSQPKSTASYIQATGRVGREWGGLVFVLFRAGRPRDLNHYELFTAYHHRLYSFVEAPTIYPFSERIMEWLSGPLYVAALRNMYSPLPWSYDPTAITHGGSASDMHLFERDMHSRGASQPPFLRPASVPSHSDATKEWKSLASLPSSLRYVDYSSGSSPVVLGLPHNKLAGAPIAYENVPQSLRDIDFYSELGF